MSWARACVAETAIALKLSCSSVWVSSFWRLPSVFRPPRPSRSLLVRSSRSAATRLMRRTAWPMSVVGVWLTGAPRSLRTGSSSASPASSRAAADGEPVDARS